ncbi:hypothetical protein I6A60_01765 [Frankia sp. AgB1.9]|uniref:hypothetical protein n=1 Tax=unclassified Frankia TaxID=2632575 RepID=UPI001933F7DE|nr:MULTISPECIES: hypothetical protein [unclassified Frankia]MBL7491334.1 hypothetical protein [Frankia sp. AgW1.1]MBL7546612.1 hypothetical protein [Frankia sp. AgB1.9]MBL7622402.1 hypothetical protein [Frankia sp. AgB1.8]
MTPLATAAGVPAALAAQVDALHTAADWVAAHPHLPIGEISARPGGQIRIHLRGSGPDEAAGALRRLGAGLPSAELRPCEGRELSAGRWGRRLELHVPVPGIELILWTYEAVPAPRMAAAGCRPARLAAVR